ncbi:MAG: PilZ domain-containing protein [bacterium]
METKLLLVVQDPTAHKEYVSILSDFDVKFEVVGTLAGLHGALLEEPYNGLLLDVGVMAKASREDRALVTDLLDLFPVLRLSWDADTSRVHSLFFGQTSGDPVQLDEFIREHCTGFQARSIRRHVRRAVHLNIKISRDETFSPETIEQTNTLDISVGGCFLYSNQNWTGQKRAWITIEELPGELAIAAAVRWFTPWGTPRRMPGIGLEFDQLSESQLSGIDQLILPR